MATRKTTRNPAPKTTASKPAHAATLATDPGPTELGADGELAKAQAEASAGCNVAGCTREPGYRGLCPAHWMTHRGEADRPWEKV